MWTRQESPFIRPRIKVRFLFSVSMNIGTEKYAYIYPVTSKNNTNMIEIPESATIGKQASETLKGKRIAHVIESNSPHRFTFYNGDPAEYSNRLVGRTVLGAQGYGAFVDILMDADTHLLIGDGTNMQLLYLRGKGPKKYQLNDRIRGRFVPSFHGFDVWFHLRFQRRV